MATEPRPSASKNNTPASEPRAGDPAPSGAAFSGFGPGGGVVDRRSGIDRRAIAKLKGEDVSETGLERRRGPGRRRTDFAKAAEEGELTKEQFLFVMAIDAFKRANGRMFPTWTDVLEVIRLLGYRKTMPSDLNLTCAEDWLEKADTPHGVRTKPGHPEGDARADRRAA